MGQIAYEAYRAALPHATAATTEVVGSPINWSRHSAATMLPSFAGPDDVGVVVHVDQSATEDFATYSVIGTATITPDASTKLEVTTGRVIHVEKPYGSQGAWIRARVVRETAGVVVHPCSWRLLGAGTESPSDLVVIEVISPTAIESGSSGGGDSV